MLFFAIAVRQARESARVSDEYLTHDDTLIEAWAGLKSSGAQGLRSRRELKSDSIRPGCPIARPAHRRESQALIARGRDRLTGRSGV